MTILFKELRKTDVVQQIKDTSMTIARKGVKNQSITVQGGEKPRTASSSPQAP